VAKLRQKSTQSMATLRAFFPKSTQSVATLRAFFPKTARSVATLRAVLLKYHRPRYGSIQMVEEHTSSVGYLSTFFQH
jgi:hypothetical protein